MEKKNKKKNDEVIEKVDVVGLPRNTRGGLLLCNSKSSNGATVVRTHGHGGVDASRFC